MTKLYVTTTATHPYVDYIIIEGVSVVLDTSANVQVLLCDYYGTELTTRNLTMIGDDYDNRACDDNASHITKRSAELQGHKANEVTRDQNRDKLKHKHK